jgi:hypothetical protein
MENLEQQLGAVLGNPEMMQQIMAMAQALGTSNPEPQEVPPPPPPMPEIDLGLIKKISGLAGQSAIDKEQQALLKALGPYLTSRRIHKLENAMRAAKMARIAATALGGNLF